MDSQQRTRILGAVLVGLLLLVGSWKLLRSWVLDPVREKQNAIAGLKQQIEQHKQQVAGIKQAERNLARWTQQSLPPNEIDAQRLYKSWITNIAEVAGFDDLTVEPGRREPKSIRFGRIRKPLYNSVQVKLTGRTTFDRLCRFLYYVHRTDLTHRVAFLKVKSEGNEGNPYLSVELHLDGLALADAAPRKRLFPETTLQQPLSPDDPRIVVAETTGFPDMPEFRLRIGRQLLTVTDMPDGQWTVRPGVDPPPNPDADSLWQTAAGAVVQHLPVTILPDKTFGFYRREVVTRPNNPFVLPIPYNPRLEVAGNTRILRGETLQLRATASGLDPANGPAEYRLTDAPEGMTIDRATGDISWTPKQDAAVKTYSAQLQVVQRRASEPVLRRELNIEVIQRNDPPVLSVPAQHTAHVGQPLRFQATARDADGPEGDLRFSLSEAPPGAAIDSRTGKFEWTPGIDDEPKTYQFEVVVTDGGSPALSDRKSVSILLREDPQRYTRLIGTINDEGEHIAFLYDISTNRKITLTEGTPFSVAGVSGFVYVIGQDFLEFQTESGESYRLHLGQFLFERKPLADAAENTTGGKQSKTGPGGRSSKTAKTADDERP